MDGWMDGWCFSTHLRIIIFIPLPLKSLFLSLFSIFLLSALGSMPILSLEHHHDSVNLSCTSSGWFPQPRLLWKFTKEGDVLSEIRTPIYTKQGNGLFSIKSWVILSSSVSNTITCSVALSEEEKRNVIVNLEPRLSGWCNVWFQVRRHREVWKESTILNLTN